MSETVETVETVDATDAVETAPVKRPRTRYTTNDGVLTVQHPEDGLSAFHADHLNPVKDALALHAYVSLHRKGATHEDILSGVAIPDYSATAPKATRGPRAVNPDVEPANPLIKRIAQLRASDLMLSHVDLTENEAYRQGINFANFCSKEEKIKLRKAIYAAALTGEAVSIDAVLAAPTPVAVEPLEYAAD